MPKDTKDQNDAEQAKNDPIERRKEIQELQAAAPYSPIVSLTPFGMILDRYIDDRKNGVANGHLRKAKLAGYNYHIDRLRPFRLEPINENTGCINLVR